MWVGRLIRKRWVGESNGEVKKPTRTCDNSVHLVKFPTNLLIRKGSFIAVTDSRMSSYQGGIAIKKKFNATMAREHDAQLC